MLGYIDTLERLHIRAISFDIQQYLFVAQVALGEDIGIAYGIIYEPADFKKHIATEEEEEHIAQWRRKGEIMLQQQECVHLRETIEEFRRAEIQQEATDLKNYKFSSEDVANMLSSLLAERSSSLEDASVRDIVTLIRELNSQGALDGNGNGFARHFISVHDPFNAICPSCNREIEIARGVTCVCPHCAAKFVWSEEEQRFYPNVEHL